MTEPVVPTTPSNDPPSQSDEAVPQVDPFPLTEVGEEQMKDEGEKQNG